MRAVASPQSTVSDALGHPIAKARDRYAALGLAWLRDTGARAVSADIFGEKVPMFLIASRYLTLCFCFTVPPASTSA